MRTKILLAVCGLAMPIFACTAPSADSTSTSSDQALTALSPSEILGAMNYGDTRTSIAYTSSPKYRAFSFHGSAGDAVDAWVRSSNGVARAWLLDASSLNVAYGVNGSPASDAHLTATLTSSGTYYVAFREASENDATFDVSLNSSSVCDPEVQNCPCDPETDNCGPPPPPPPPPPPSTGVYDDTFCQGAAMTQAQALAYFTTASSVSGPIGAGYRTAAHIRTCTQLTGCTGWSDTPEWPKINVSGSVSTYPSSGALNLELIGAGAGQTIQLDVGAPISSAQAFCPAIGGAAGPCNYYPGALDGLVVGATTTQYPVATFTDNCFRIKLTGQLQNSPDATHYQDIEAVIYATF